MVAGSPKRYFEARTQILGDVEEHIGEDETVVRTADQAVLVFAVLLLMLADAYGAHRLDADMQDELLRIGTQIGLDEQMSDAEAEDDATGAGADDEGDADEADEDEKEG